MGGFGHVLTHPRLEAWIVWPGQEIRLSDRGALDMTKQLLRHFRIDLALYQIGRSKLFLRAGVLGHLEGLRTRILR